MAHTIAIAGKGGTGKTTLAALLVRLVKEKKLGSCLAVDADPNSNLAEALGVGVKDTVSGILDNIAGHMDRIPQGWTKDRFIEYHVQAAVQEAEGFDILTMGKPEGAGCYCYVNNVLRDIIGKLTSDYEYVIIDNEAGLEHLSRRTTRSADVLLVVSDATTVGLKAAKRIADIVRELDIKTGAQFLVINRWDEKIDKARLEKAGLEYIGNVPLDEEIAKISLNGTSLWELSSSSRSLGALKKLGNKIWQLN